MPFLVPNLDTTRSTPSLQQTLEAATLPLCVFLSVTLAEECDLVVVGVECMVDRSLARGAGVHLVLLTAPLAASWFGVGVPFFASFIESGSRPALHGLGWLTLAAVKDELSVVSTFETTTTCGDDGFTESYSSDPNIRSCSCDESISA